MEFRKPCAVIRTEMSVVFTSPSAYKAQKAKLICRICALSQTFVAQIPAKSAPSALIALSCVDLLQKLRLFPQFLPLLFLL
eukprot:3196459-Pleurochrysis_carterae.AAC.1